MKIIRNQQIVEMRERGMTLQQIAKEIGLSRERVNQIVSKSNIKAPTDEWGVIKKPLYASVWRLDYGDNEYTFHPTRKEAVHAWSEAGYDKKNINLLWIQFGSREGLSEFMNSWTDEVTNNANEKIGEKVQNIRNLLYEAQRYS